MLILAFTPCSCGSRLQSSTIYTVIEGRRTLNVSVQLLFGATDVDFTIIVSSSDVDAEGQWIM